jgi:YgiT-type zinc finger domain-containing protein
MTANLVKIKTCPSCGSEKIKKVRRNWCGEYQGCAYAVAGLEYYECANCGEKIYDRQAMRKIEACSPAFASHRPTRKSA